MYIRPRYIQHVTVKEASLLLGSATTPLGQEARIRLMLGNKAVRAFSPTDVRGTLGDNYIERLTASSICWRNALTSLIGPPGPLKKKPASLYYVVMDVDALKAILGRAEPVPVNGIYRAKTAADTPGTRPN